MTRRYRIRYTARNSHGIWVQNGPSAICVSAAPPTGRCSGSCEHTFEIDLEAYSAADAVTQAGVLFDAERAHAGRPSRHEDNWTPAFRIEWIRPTPPVGLEEEKHDSTADRLDRAEETQ